MTRPVIGLLLLILAVVAGTRGSRTIYSDLWAVEVAGGPDVARQIADRHGFQYLDEIMPGFYHFRHAQVSKRSTHYSPQYQEELASEPEVKWLAQQIVKRRVKRDLYFTDPKWPRMWYLNRADGGNMNVEKAWVKGFTGKGVVISILDDGIETNHPDLARNYDPRASYDVNAHDSDPTPRYDQSNENRHGTRCAGEVAAVADNNICSLGVAFNANIGGVRMLDGDVTDSVEAASLSLNRDHIDIYSASWGPDDDGRTVDGPSYMARKAFFDGVSKGRRGLGSIFVWASGNGGRDGDNCNCDGYTNSIYTLSISSATENGNIPWYSEACSSTLASTYSSGSGTERQVVTTDLRQGCTETHTGTSASAPLAAGICALTLQANPRLTWRDMQHIVVRTANPRDLHAYDWIINGVGRKVSHSFGYGIMDASAMVDLAQNWTSVPEQHMCEVFAPIVQHDRQVPVGGAIRVKLATDGCRGLPNQVVYVEHVIVKLSLQASRRGEVQIFLVSPQGTRSTLLAKRSNDMSRDGFSNWSFMTTHSWGEFANGSWVLEVENGDNSFRPIRLRDWSLLLYGTGVHPQFEGLNSETSTPLTTPKPPSTTPDFHTSKSSKNVAISTNLALGHKQPHSGLRHQTNRDESPDKPARDKQRGAHTIEYNCSSGKAKAEVEGATIQSMFINDVKPERATTEANFPEITSTKGELKKWSLILHGTREHPQAGKYQPKISAAQHVNCGHMNFTGYCVGWWLVSGVLAYIYQLNIPS